MCRASGLIKYCLEGGYRVVPVYTFDESDTYSTLQGFTSIRLWFNKYKIPMCIFFGRWWCPVLPRSEARLLTYVGAPLELPQIASPTPADVELW